MSTTAKRDRSDDEDDIAVRPKRPRADATLSEETAAATQRISKDDLLDSGDYKRPPGNPEIQAKKLFFNRQNLQDAFEHVLPRDRDLIDSYLFEIPIVHFDLTRLNLEQLRSKVEPVSRAYENQYLREPTGTERRCVMGKDCEGHFVNSGGPGFTLREFLLPSQQEAVERTRILPRLRHMCLLCQRNKIAEQFFMIKASGQAMKAQHIIQNYCNIVGIADEYVLEDCILSDRGKWEGLVAPLVMHNRKNYKFVEKNGLKCLQQLYGLPFLTNVGGN